MSTLTLETPARPAARCELLVGGELDIGTVPALYAALRRTQRTGTDVALDLSRVTFIDICTARSIVQAVFAASSAGRTLTIVTPSPAVERVLELMGADDLVAVGPAEHVTERG